MSAYALACATVLGRDHAALRKNAQDAFAAGEVGADAAFGVVCDGCGEGKRSEIGAGLAAAVLGAELERGLAGGVPAGELPAMALDRLLQVFAALADAVASGGGDARRRIDFVCDHLLTTVVGFCVRGREGIAFWCGDGLVALDGEVVVLDEADRPRYPAYAALGAPAARMPHGWRRFDAAAVARIAVATDGFDPELVPSAFGRRGHALKRWMNVCSRGGHFRDDATIVTAERSGRPAP